MLYAVVLEARNYIVGEANAPSGLHVYDDAGGWSHRGWANVRGFGLAVAGPETFYLACGNGVLRSRDGGATWRVTTDWRVTEVLDVALDPGRPGVVMVATAYGVWRSGDEGATWAAVNDGLSVPSTTFVQAIAADRSRPDRWLIGTEDGLFASTGGAWTPLGPRVPIRSLVQHPAAPADWWAGTEDHGVLRSADSGATWSFAGGDAAGATVYAVAVAPQDPLRVAAGGYPAGLLLSTDGGRSWRRCAADVPGRAVHALAFDPAVPGHLWIGTVGDGVCVTDDGGATCRAAGLPEATVYRLVFAG